MREASRRCSGSALPFLAGVTLPILLLAAPYLATGSLGDLYTGLFVTPRGRLESGYYGTAAPVAFVFAVPVLVVLLALRRRTRAARNADVAASVALGALVLVSTVTLVGYQTMWYTTTSLLPVGVFVGVAVLARHADPGARAPLTSVFLLLALTAFVGLVQFPFGAPVYFCFVAPLAVLAWLAMFRHTPLHKSSSRIFPSLLLASIVAFGFVVNHSLLYWDGMRPNGNPQTVILDRDRAWIRVRPMHRAVYLETSALLRAHARGRVHLCRPGYARDLRAHRASQPDAIVVRLPRPVELRAGGEPPAHAPNPRCNGDRHQPATRLLRPARAEDGGPASRRVSASQESRRLRRPLESVTEARPVSTRRACSRPRRDFRRRA